MISHGHVRSREPDSPSTRQAKELAQGHTVKWVSELINCWLIVSSNLVRETNHTNKGRGEVKQGDNKLQQKGMEPSVDALGIGVCAREEATVCVCI